MDLHTPVLLEPVISLLDHLSRRDIFVDATLGLGGHSQSLLEHLSSDGILYGFDRDRENLERATDRLSTSSHTFIPVHSSFDAIPSVLLEQGVREIDFCLYDLGVSSVHYDEFERWFSFRADGPLDMRFDRSQGMPVSEWLATADVREIARVLDRYGEEPRSWQIAHRIVDTRLTHPILTTLDLLSVISSATYDKKAPLRVFQALRIEHNQEFAHIERSIQGVLPMIRSGGMIAVITFHSLEDRLVKHLLDAVLHDEIDEITGQTRVPAPYQKYTKKPMVPSEEEIAHNPRSRSAKLRVLIKR